MSCFLREQESPWDIESQQARCSMWTVVSKIVINRPVQKLMNAFATSLLLFTDGGWLHLFIEEIMSADWFYRNAFALII